jgi:hypothetical protein
VPGMVGVVLCHTIAWFQMYFGSVIEHQPYFCSYRVSLYFGMINLPLDEGKHVPFLLLTHVAMSVWYRQPENTPATKPIPSHNAELILTD